MRLVQFASITKKMALAAVGLFLLLFLPVHLGINLCILREDQGEWYRIASHFMGTNYIVKVFEVVLMATILLHIVIALLLTLENLRARPVRYKVVTKSKTHFMSKYMILTGGFIAVFLVIHFINFYFVKLDIVEGKYSAKLEQIDQHFQAKAKLMQNGELKEDEQTKLVAQYQALSNISPDKVDAKGKNLINLSKEEVIQYCGEDFKHVEPDFYVMSKDFFKNKYYSLLYLLSFIVLGLHLMHAINSLAQTFGLSHTKYNNAIEIFAIAYSIIIPLGFAIIPIAIMFFGY